MTKRIMASAEAYPIALFDLYASVYLRKLYWRKKKTLWTHGYFCSTIGNVSEERIKNYIENQS